MNTVPKFPPDSVLENTTERTNESSLIRAIIVSNSLLLIFCILSYFIYNLFYDYLTIVIFAVISSIALRKTKDNIVLQIYDFIYQENFCHYKNSLFHSFINWIFKYIINFKNNSFSEIWKNLMNFMKLSTNDTNIITIVFTMYFLWIMFPTSIIFLIIIVIFFLDFFIRITLDLFNFVKCSMDCKNEEKKDKKEEKKKFKKISHSIFLIFFQNKPNVKSWIDTIVSIIIIFVFILLLLGLFILVISLCVRDIKLLIENSKSIINMTGQKINYFFGIDKNFLLNQNKDNILITNYFEEILNAFLSKKELQTAVDAFKTISEDVFKRFNLTNSNDNFSYNNNNSFSMISNNLNGMKHILVTYVGNDSNYNEYYFNCTNVYDYYTNFSMTSFLNPLSPYYCSLDAFLSIFFKLNLNYNDLTNIIFTLIQKLNAIFSNFLKILFGTILLEIILVSKSIIDSFFNFLIYIFCLFYLLNSKENILTKITSLIPVNIEIQNNLNETLYRSIRGVFICSIKISYFHILFTWMAFNYYSIDFEFITALLAGIMSLIPLFSPWILSLPVGIYFLIIGDLWNAILFPIVYTLISNKIFMDIYQNSIDVHPYVTGLSIFMGIYAFNIKGIIYGPLLVCLTLIIYEFTKKTSFNDLISNEKKIFQKILRSRTCSSSE